jgi:murein DD-endopeptidase MepM/ murein hydrolase activator NlpD
MPPTESRISKALPLWSAAAPHGAAVFAFLLGVALIVAGLVGSDPVEANRISITGQSQAIISPQANLPALEPSPSPSVTGNRIIEAEVRRGDTLSIIFGRAGLPTATLQQVLDADRRSHALQDLFPGQNLRFEVDATGTLVTFRHSKSPLETTVYERKSDSFSARSEVRTPEIRRAFRHAVVKRSMYEAGQDAGLSGRMILELANVLGGVVDFALDPRVGDTFSVLFEEKYLDGERIAEGAIIAAEYVNEGRRHTAYRFTDSAGQTGYYGGDGVSMRKMFLRAPLDFTRVSSNFNMRRLHPIARVVRPHRGVDYSAPTGTPVYASGDGRVTEAGYSRGNGNYVFIAHDGRIVTRYLHLHKRLVKAGQRVSQGQTIGTVGATGLATGPHLHYEFLVDGSHRNPRTELDKLPRARTLDKREMARFSPEVSGLQTLLAKYGAAWELAVANADQN